MFYACDDVFDVSKEQEAPECFLVGRLTPQDDIDTLIDDTFCSRCVGKLCIQRKGTCIDSVSSDLCRDDYVRNYSEPFIKTAA